MKESPWTIALAEWWAPQGVLMVPIVGTRFQSSWPDRYLASLKWCGFIEFKNPDTPITDAQWLNIQRLNQFGSTACVVRRLQTRKDFKNEYTEIYITNKKQAVERVSVSNLLETLARCFSSV